MSTVDVGAIFFENAVISKEEILTHAGDLEFVGGYIFSIFFFNE